MAPWALLSISAILMFLGFAGFAIWPLAFVGIVPALFVFDPTETRGGFERPSGWRFLPRALWFGYLAELGGFYWLIHTLTTFSGFPTLVCWAIASIFFLFQGLQFVTVLALWMRARARGWPAAPALVAAFVAIEALFPMLFEHYYGNSLHPVPVLMQIADLGGPLLCSALIMLVSGALYELASARLRGEPLPIASPVAALIALAFTIGYGFIRIADVEARIASAPHLELGVVQTNQGLFDRWDDPQGAVHRHVAATHELTREHDLDLVLWPESSVSYFVPRGIESLEQWRAARALGITSLDVPLLFGGMRQATREDGAEVDRNTAVLVGRDHRILGSYDKTFLLAFGEYLPFGEQLPVLYDISPMSGRFTPGNDYSPLVLPAEGERFRLAILICYEDIVSSFVRRAVNEGEPHLLLNLTNDSWFGESVEPWIHMHLARFRAIEHRRYLVRATTTGVSAFIDPAGRVVSHTPSHEPATLTGEVAMLTGTTLYQQVGAWPGWLALVAIVLMCFRPARYSLKRPPAWVDSATAT